MTTKNASKDSNSPRFAPGDQVLVNSILGVITSWPDDPRPDSFFNFEVRHLNGSVDRHTEQLGTVTIESVPKLGE